MATFTHPMQHLAHQTRLSGAILDKAKKMHTDMVILMAKEATALVLGGITTEELTAMGHPFARRKLSRRGFSRTRNPNVKGRRLSEKVAGRNVGAAISIPLLPINAQNGRLRKSLRMRSVPPPPGGQIWELGYTTPYAKYVLGRNGTSLMVARGFLQQMEKIGNRRKKLLQHDINLMILRASKTGKV